MTGPGVAVCLLGCAVVVLARVARRGDLRAAWSALGAGLLLGAAAEVAGSVAPADLFRALSGAGLLLGLALLLRQHLHGVPLSAWADGAVTAVCAVTVVLATALAPALDIATVAPVPHVPGVAVVDLCVLALTIGAMTTGGCCFDTRLYALSAGLMLLSGGHLATVLDALTSDHPAGWWLLPVRLAGCLLLAVAAWLPEHPRPFDTIIRWPTLLPAAGVVVGTVALWAIVGPSSPVAGVTVAGMALVGAVARIAIVLGDGDALAESWRQAHTDELTGLPNRRALLAVLREAPPGEPLALLLANLNRFKEVNDSLGHQVADELLSQVAHRMRARLDGAHLLVRLGDDEFAVLLQADDPRPAGRLRHGPWSGRGQGRGRGAAHLGTAFAVAEEVVTALTPPFALDGIALHVQASVGIALLPDHAEEPYQLLQRAGVAMLTAKSGGDGAIDVYRPTDDPHSRERLELIEDLIEALRSGALTCHFQPKVSLASDEVHSMEALVRWHHPTRGAIPPETLVALAEHAGLMRQLTDAVLGHALSQAQAWREAGMDLPVAINLSPTSLLDADLPDQIARGLQAYRLPASALQVEITETVMMTDSPRARQTLTRLRELGISTSIDDYGTGWSSLAYLHELDADELKLDRMFISRLTSDPGAAAIVRSTIDLAHSLGLRLVAEGVEDEKTASALRRYGCDLSQGFHHCRPLSGPAVTAWLSQRVPCLPPVPAAPQG